MAAHFRFARRPTLYKHIAAHSDINMHMYPSTLGSPHIATSVFHTKKKQQQQIKTTTTTTTTSTTTTDETSNNNNNNNTSEQ
jgi:hypothetical protein